MKRHFEGVKEKLRNRARIEYPGNKAKQEEYVKMGLETIPYYSPIYEKVLVQVEKEALEKYPDEEQEEKRQEYIANKFNHKIEWWNCDIAGKVPDKVMGTIEKTLAKEADKKKPENRDYLEKRRRLENLFQRSETVG